MPKDYLHFSPLSLTKAKLEYYNTNIAPTTALFKKIRYVHGEIV